MYNMCKNKVMSPAIFRLFESDRRKAWAGARSQIIHDNKIADERARLKLESVRETKKTR